MAAEGSVLVPRVKTRTVGAPISNICTFQADVLPGVNFAAYTLSDGCIVLQQVCKHKGSRVHLCRQLGLSARAWLIIRGPSGREHALFVIPGTCRGWFPVLLHGPGMGGQLQGGVRHGPADGSGAGHAY